MGAGLTTSLQTLVNALNTNQTTLSYISDNIANVNTKGYTRRIVAQETQVSNGTPVGVGVAEIRRSIDDFLLKSVRAQLSNMGQSTVKNAYYSKLQQFSFGDPGSPYTVTNSLNEFYSRLQGFSGDPSSAVQRNLVINSAVDFANTVTELSTSIQNERFNADTEISDTIDTLNDTLDTLFDINGAIRQSAAVGGDLQSLYDARDFQLNNLKEIIDADFSFDTFGQVSVSLASTELLGFSQRYLIEYSRSSSADDFINNVGTGAITITSLDTSGNKTENVSTLLSASSATTQVDNIADGSLRALIDIRDTEFPKMLDQLDQFVYTFATEFNALHNTGTGFPPAENYTGTNAVTLADAFNFSGQARFTLTDENGAPVLGRFGDDMLPLVIDFDRFNGDDGFGTASVQNIIDEFNNYYSTQPTNIANLGPAANIQLAAVSDSMTSAEATGTVTFSGQPLDTETLVLNGATITFVSGTPGANEVQIGSSLGETLTNLEEFLNSSANASIDDAEYSVAGSILTITSKVAGTSGNSYTIDESDITGATASGATLAGGADVSGTFTFDFDFTNFAADGEAITFDVTQIDLDGGGAGAVTFSTYTQEPGERFRTNEAGGTGDSLSVNLAALNLEEGDTFTITATVVVVDGDGVSHTEDITYTITVPDPDDNIINTRYEPTAIGAGDGELETGTSTAGFATASLVDADGNPITDTTTPGYLKIDTTSGSYRLSIDPLDSAEGGDLSATDPEDTATDRNFSHFFGLNDFFTFGGELENAAINFSIRSDIIDTPSLLSSGKAKQSISLGNDAIYTYEIGAGSNEAALEMVALQDVNLSFDSAGGLPELSTTVNFYISEIYSFAANAANDAEAEFDKDTLLNDALASKFDDISGVNLDEELAMTIMIQNAYSAAAKVLGVVRELFSKIEEVLA